MVKSGRSVLVALAFAVGACGGSGATPTASLPAASAAVSPSPAPSTTPRPSAGESVAACAFEPVGYPGGSDQLKAPSDRLVNALAKAGPNVDTLTFVFELKGPASSSGAAPIIRIQEAKPPFSYAGSGKSFQALGDRYLQVVFDGMTIADADGSPVFTGSALQLGKFTGLRDAVQYDDFEGVLGWIVGFSDPVCVTVVAGAPNEVVLSIAHN